jgi:hypothetical protein
MIAAPDVAQPPQEGTLSLAYKGMLSQLYERAASTFAAATTSRLAIEAVTRTSDRTSGSAVPDPEVIAEFADVPELRAVEELRSWLRLPYRQVALVAGLRSPSLIYHWRERHRDGHPVRARASTLEHLWRVHSVIRAIAEALEGADHSYAAQLWARQEHDGVSPLDLLLNGEIDEVERLARILLFEGEPTKTSPTRTATLEQDEDLETDRRSGRPALKDTDFG